MEEAILDPLEEEGAEALVDGALELRLRLLEHRLRSVSRHELIEVVLDERRTRVLDRRFFLLLLLDAGLAAHGMPADEWGFGDEDSMPDPLDEDELTLLMGRRPTRQEGDLYIEAIEAIEARLDGVQEKEVVDWALQMPDR